MKQILLSIACLLMIIGCISCKKPQPPVNTDCIDPSKIQKNANCTMEYDPVCGCDGKTYGNPCLAGISGVKSWKKGECSKRE